MKAFYERLLPFATPFMALFGRSDLPHRSTLSRFLAALNQSTLEALRALFQEDVLARNPFPSSGGLFDRTGEQWMVVDVDGTRQAARQRALPQTESLPDPHRRFDQVCTPGYQGRKRGEVARTRTVILQAHTHQFLGTDGGTRQWRLPRGTATSHLGDHQLCDQAGASHCFCTATFGWSLWRCCPADRCPYRWPWCDCAARRDYRLLDLEVVKQALARSPDQVSTHPESRVVRALYDCPAVPLTPAGPEIRLVVATHTGTSSPPKIGVERDGTVYELFVCTLPSPTFAPSDVLDLYLHRGSFETVLAEEDQEQDSDRWYSHTPCGQEFCQILAQWVWNTRLELGQKLSSSDLRTTEFAPASVVEPLPPIEPRRSEKQTPLAQYGPPQWARPSFTKGFPGSAFIPQPDGTLRCPADRPLYPQERRSERDGSLRVLYAARIGHCRSCPLRAQCQESSTTIKPRRVSAVLWPLESSRSDGSPMPTDTPTSLPLVLVHWKDWSCCHIRREWLKVIRRETVVFTFGATPAPSLVTPAVEEVLSRAQRAHWRLSWEQRLAHNVRSSDAPRFSVTLHGLPATFARSFGFDLLATA